LISSELILSITLGTFGFSAILKLSTKPEGPVGGENWENSRAK